MFIQMVTWRSNIVCGTTVHYGLQRRSHIELIVTMATQMSDQSRQTTNCSLIGDTLAGCHGYTWSTLTMRLVLGQCLHVRKDYYQHQARFHWPRSPLRHHSHFTTTANFLYIHPIYHSITSSIYLSIHQIPVYFQAAFHLCRICNSHMVSTWRMTCNQQWICLAVKTQQ